MLQIKKQEADNAVFCYILLIAAHFFLLLTCVGILADFGVFLFLLSSAFSKKEFLRAHARQALALFVVELILAVILLIQSAYWPYYIVIFLIVIGAAILGVTQVRRGNSWIGNFHAEIVGDLPTLQVKQRAPSMTEDERREFVAKYLITYRTGDQFAREAALNTLEAMGEVETF